jgi:hypothetical protein
VLSAPTAPAKASTPAPESAHDAGTHMREDILPFAQALEQNGIRYPALVARLGADTYAYIEQWLAQLEAEGT